MLKLYGGEFSRASIVQWYLEELQVAHELVRLDMKAAEHREPEFLAVNPMGKVPAIAEAEFRLWESGAILLYLAEKHDQFPNTPEERAKIYQWVLFSNSTLAQSVLVEANREREMPRLLAPLNQHFKAQPFLMGQEFSVADVAVGSALAFISMMLKLDLSDSPEVVNYSQRLSERPAFQKAMG